jgi:hypothetical protein
MNAPKNGTPVSQLKLDEGPLTIVPRTIRLRDEPPLAVRRAEVPTEAHAALDAIARGKAGQAFTESMCSNRAPDAIKPPKLCDLRNHVSGDRDVDARYTIPGASPFDAEGLDAVDQSERWTVANAETPGGTFEDTDASLGDGGCRSRRASRQQAYERLQDELELVQEVGDLIREELREELEQWRHRAIRNCLAACVCVFVAGLAIGALVASLL